MNLKELLKQAKEKGHSIDSLIKLSEKQDLDKVEALPENGIAEDEMKEFAKAQNERGGGLKIGQI